MTPAGIYFGRRDILVRQRTQTINALRAHLAEQGIVAPTGPAHVGCLAAVIDGDNGTLPSTVRDLARLLLDQIAVLRGRLRIWMPNCADVRASMIPRADWRRSRAWGRSPLQQSLPSRHLWRPSQKAATLRLGLASRRDSIRAAARSANRRCWLRWRWPTAWPELPGLSPLGLNQWRLNGLLRKGEDYRDPAMATA